MAAMKPPRAFLCHGSEDKLLAERIATDLRAAGIEVFFDKWEIRAGDSLRQKIDEGLGDCSHFIALLTPRSVNRPWVRAEMDAGFVRKVGEQAVFIPLRFELRPDALPPLLKALYSPSIGSDYAMSIKELVADIHGINRKPPLGPVPATNRSSFPLRSGLSIAAEKVAELFVLKSEVGRADDPQLDVEHLRQETGYTDTQLIDAVDELEEAHLLKPARVIGAPPFGYVSVFPTDQLFEKFDPLLMEWKPEHDAVTVAAVLVATREDGGGMSSHDIMASLGWTPRRMNPALAYLMRRDLVMVSRNLDATFVTTHLFPTPKTRRFVREHSR